jgi:MoxR-like ATPase
LAQGVDAVPGPGTHKRVLLIGPTGVDKAAAVRRIAERLKQTLGHQPKYVDFENDYLKSELRSPSQFFSRKTSPSRPLFGTTLGKNSPPR